LSKRQRASAPNQALVHLQKKKKKKNERKKKEEKNKERKGFFDQ
jgi:hypothetical protein